MSEEILHDDEHIRPNINYVQFMGNVQGIIGTFQPSITSPAKVVKMTMDVNNISACVVDEVQYFKFNDKEVDEALLKYRLDLEKDIDHKEVVDLFGDLHNMLDKVVKRTYYMNSGAIITTATSPYTEEFILTDDKQYFIMNASVPDWWMKNTGLKTIVDAIRQHIPDFSPWKGADDTMTAYLIASQDRRSPLLPKKHA